LWAPWALFALGVAMNAIVVGVNHSLMPVRLPDCSLYVFPVSDMVHTCMTPASHLKFFADWIVIGQYRISSIGDFLQEARDLVWQFCFGAWVALQCVKDCVKD